MSSKQSAFRFAVGAPDDLRSHIWRIWVQGDDVYLGARDMLQALKVSLHRSNIWRIAFVKELAGKDAGTDRAVVKWRRPAEFAPGWTGSVAVLVSPIEPRRPFRAPPVDDPRIQWFPPATKRRRLLFKVIFAEAGHTDISHVILPTDRTLGPLMKKNGEGVWLVLREDNLTLIELSKISEVMANLKINLHAGSSVSSVTDSRSLLVVAPDAPGITDQPTIFDIALGKENVHIDLA